MLLASVQRHDVVSSFATTLIRELGTEAEVEISAAGITGNEAGESGTTHNGLMLRDVTRRLPARSAGRDATRDTPAERLLSPLEKLTEKIGQIPLLQLARDSSDLIERHCIEGALEQADGNRTAAAELLGLSRR